MSTARLDASAPEPPIQFDASGLVPAVVQDAVSRSVLMVGFMNAAALAATRETGRVHFWSRSRAKLWRKGETSGHEQIVDQIFVNCDRNSLLVTARQIGTVCHDGYPTCYYRRLNDDDSLTIVQERTFDPAAVYPSREEDELARLSRLLFGAYAFLRDGNLEDVSETSRRLRADDDTISARLAEELDELAGALDGSHRHDGFAEDVLLESTQVLYWTTLYAIRAEASWSQVRPDRALRTAADGMSPSLLAKVIAVEADRWRSPTGSEEPAGPRCHAVLALVGQACHAAGHAPSTPIEADLASLRTRVYLRSYFSDAEKSDLQAG